MKAAVGDRRGNLVVVEVRPNKNGGTSVVCECSCGETREFPMCLVFGKSPKYASCNINGCRQRIIKHGAKANGRVMPEYRVWATMIQRCENKNNAKWPIYGGRGIRVCAAWKIFSNFIKDMGRRPTKTTLGRIDNGGNYEPSNCRWETVKQQARNRRNNRLLSLGGETKTVVEWAESKGVDPDFLHGRLQLGWDTERVINEPKHKR